MRSCWRRLLGSLRVSGDVPFFSTVTGGLLDTASLDGEYWYRNLRETVQFEQVMRALLGEGHGRLSRSARIRC